MSDQDTARAVEKGILRAAIKLALVAGAIGGVFWVVSEFNESVAAAEKLRHDGIRQRELLDRALRLAR